MIDVILTIILVLLIIFIVMLFSYDFGKAKGYKKALDDIDSMRKK